MDGVEGVLEDNVDELRGVRQVKVEGARKGTLDSSQTL
jgi:hypothetical protein